MAYPRKRYLGVQELKLGPFAGGINAYSDQSAIADNEMVDCINFDIDLDGSLKSRPPWTLYKSITTTIATGTTPPNSDQLILYSGTYGAVRFAIIQSNHSGTDNVYIQYFDGVNAGTLSLIAAGLYSKAVRYDDFIYIVPLGTTSLGTGQRYALSSGATTTIANMPNGYSAVVYKDRLWISGRRNIPNNSRLFFCAIGDFTSWPTTNFFDINPGDGDAMQDMTVYQDNLVCFKDSATYVLSYDTNVAGAVLQMVNADIGVTGPRCVVNYENSVFVLKYNQVYEMVNYDFTRVSVKVPFEFDNLVPSGFTGQDWRYPICMSLVGDRLICSFYNRTYVYHLRLRAWTKYQSNDVNINYLGPIVLLDNTNVSARQGFNTYIATSSLAKNIDNSGPGISSAWKSYFKLFMMEDRYSNSAVENGESAPPATPVNISLKAVTKAFDVGVSHRFKRLTQWGADVITSRSVTGTVYPFSVSYQVTWAQLHSTQWHNLNTWQYPLFAVPSTVQAISTSAGIARRYIKFPKALRFRLVQFQIDMVTIGNTTDGPARLYSVTMFMSGKAVVPSAVS